MILKDQEEKQKVFDKADKNKDGKINEEQFNKIVNSPEFSDEWATRDLEDDFGVLDTKKQGEIDFE